MENQKQQLRQRCRGRRRTLSDVEQSQASRAFARRFQTTHFFQHTTFACYLAHDGELDLMPFIQALWQAQKMCVLPTVLSGNQLRFQPYQPNTTLQRNRYGILEPATESAVPLDTINVALLPVVAFDRFGGRLGMGAGYYDRVFADRRPLLLGVAHHCQEVAKVPMTDWDVVLDAVITDREIIEVSSCI